jgi:hypothetical protein
MGVMEGTLIFKIDRALAANTALVITPGHAMDTNEPCAALKYAFSLFDALQHA